MDWKQAYKWQKISNIGKQSFSEPIWSWDCGLKLDFDGPLLRVSSRFYQMNDNIFDGSVSFMIGDNYIYTQEFSSRNIDVLKKDIESYIDNVNKKLECYLKEIVSGNPFTLTNKF